MGHTVDVPGLRAAADGYVTYGNEFKGSVAAGVAQCSLPWTAIPLVDMGFKAAYGNAYEALDLSTRALGDILYTIGLALTRVANHYEDNDAANAQMFQGKPITAPTSPEPREMSGTANLPDWLRLGGEGGSAAALIAWAGRALIVSSVPFGVSFIGIIGSLLGAAALNVRDPLPYFDAYEGWGQVRSVLNEAAARVPKLCNDVVYRGNWEGDGKDAFYACINNDIAPTMAAMKDLNNDMQTACREAGLSLIASLALFVSATLTAIAVVETANTTAELTAGVAAPEAAAIAQITLAEWIGFVTQLLIDVGAVFGGLSVGAAQVGQSYDTLKAFLGGRDQKLEVGSLKLRPPELARIQDWENSWKEPEAT